MKILITGATGMVGRNILEHTNAQVHEFLTPSSSDLNLCDKKSVFDFVEKYRPELVIHCAGHVGGIQANMREPVKFLSANMEMGINILLAAEKFGTERVVNLSSSCMYPKDHHGFLEEELILTGPLEPTNEGYALAKISVMRLGQYINREKNKDIVKTLIPCNLYGRWDKFGEQNSHMVPAIIRKVDKAKLASEKSVEIWGSGNARREFMYAGDLADFIYFAIQNWEKVPALINVGLGHDHSVNDYYKEVASVLNYTGGFHHDLTKPEGMKQKLVSVKKSEELGWKAKTSLRDGIKKAYEFYIEQGLR